MKVKVQLIVRGGFLCLKPKSVFLLGQLRVYNGISPSTTTAASWKTSLINHMYNKAIVNSAFRL